MCVAVLYLYKVVKKRNECIRDAILSLALCMEVTSESLTLIEKKNTNKKSSLFVIMLL